MLLRLREPSGSILCSIGNLSAARRLYSAVRASEAFLASSAVPMRPTNLSPLYAPNWTPLALAAASASFVRLLIASRSCSATSAIIPIVSRLASGMSAAMKSIPASLRLSRKAASLVSLSILATTRVAPEALQRSMASVSFGRRLFFPLSISTNSSITFQSPPFR